MDRQIRVSAKALVIRDGRMLAVRVRDQDGDFFILPGGGQRAGELLPDAVARENYIGFAMAINVPINASETLSLQPFFGPGFSWGLSSKTDWTNPITNQKETLDNYDEDTHYLRQYSYLTVGADILLKSLHLRLRGSVDFGMWDRYSSVKEITTKDGPNLRLGVAYLF